MVAINEELWNIFTYYSLHGTMTDPFHLTTSQLSKLCKETLLFNKKSVEKALDSKHCHVLVRETSYKRSGGGETSAAKHSLFLNFANFLDVLAELGTLCYPSSDSVEDAFESILMNNILPFAARRSRDILEFYVVENIEVATIFTYYEKPLQKIFAYYAADSASPDGTKKSNITVSKQGNGNSPRKSPMKSPVTLRPSAPSSSSVALTPYSKNNTSLVSSRSPNRQSGDNVGTEMHAFIGYSDFLRFMNDTGLAIALQTTTYDLSHIFLVVMQAKDFNFTSRNLEYAEFCEVLIKCAVVGFRGKNVSLADKTHALFMFMSRQVDQIVSLILHGKGSVSSSENAAFVSRLTDGIKSLRTKFQKAWSEDGFRDYLSDLPPPPLTKKKNATSMLEHLSSIPNDEDGNCDDDGDDDEYGLDDLMGRSGQSHNTAMTEGGSSYKIKGSIDRHELAVLQRMEELLCRRPQLSANMKMMVDGVGVFKKTQGVV